MSRPLRILVVDDREEDLERVRESLLAGRLAGELIVVPSLAALRQRLPDRWDAVISDDRLVDGDALAVLDQVRAVADVPVIVVTAGMTDERAVQLMAAGVDDVVRKESLGRLAPVLRRELREFRERRLRRAAEEALHRTELELREVIDAAPIGIAICHGETIAYANRALLAYFATESTGFVGQPVASLAPVEEQPRLVANLLTEDQSAVGQEFRFLRRDGVIGTMEIGGMRRLTFGGLPSVLVTLRDVTEERKLRERLQMADRMSAIGTLAGGIAHEINNPLACVTANLEVLREELSGSADPPPVGGQMPLEEMIAAIDDARQGAERVRLIVRDLKLFARHDPSPRRGPVDLAAVLATAERMTASLMRERAQLVQEHAQLPPVYGDALDLCQVFINLLANAAQAIEPGAPGDNQVRVHAAREGNRVRVEVHDTGAGVPEALRSRIFDAFFTTKGVGGGQGLGLSVCHGIVTGIGGEIAVRSGATGRGTVVSVALPLWQGAPGL
jgi:two-component system, NtrC family, sensor kinase